MLKAGVVLALKRSRAQAILRVWLLNSSCLLKETCVYFPPKGARLRKKGAGLKPLRQDLEPPLVKSVQYFKICVVSTYDPP